MASRLASRMASPGERSSFGTPGRTGRGSRLRLRQWRCASPTSPETRRSEEEQKCDSSRQTKMAAALPFHANQCIVPASLPRPSPGSPLPANRRQWSPPAGERGSTWQPKFPSISLSKGPLSGDAPGVSKELQGGFPGPHGAQRRTAGVHGR